MNRSIFARPRRAAGSLFVALLLLPAVARAQPAALTSEVAGLRAARPAWREIAWRPCLLEGLRESREKHKPVLLWVFIDRPADDARC